MLFNIVNQMRSRIYTIEAFLRLYEVIDSPLLDAPQKAALELLSLPRSNMIDEKMFRHCSVVGRLYAVYENFVEDLLVYWYTKLPCYFKHEELNESFKSKYRVGISKLVKDIDKRRYKHLVLDHILETYLKGISNNPPWAIVSDALILHETNLRRNELESLFCCTGIDGYWAMLEKSEDIADYIESYDSETSLEKLIENFVNIRNEAVHGAPDELLGIEELKSWVRFILIVCASMANIIMLKIIQNQTMLIPDICIGRVIEKFRNNIVVALCKNGKLDLNQDIFAVRPTSIVFAKIISLQVNDRDVETISFDGNEVEVGIKTNVELQRDATIFGVNVFNA